MLKLFRPWRHPVRLLRTMGYVLTALPVAIVALRDDHRRSSRLSVGLLITFVLAVPIAWLLFVWSRAIGHVERSRIDAPTDVRDRRPGPAAAAQALAPPARGAGALEAAVEGDRLPPRPPAGRGHRVRPVAPRPGAARSRCVPLPVYVDELPGDSAKFYFFEVTSGARRALAAARRARRHRRSSPRGSRSGSAPDGAGASPRRLLGPSPDEAHAAAGDPARDEPHARPSTAPRPSGDASSATCTTAPSSASSRWPPTSGPHARSSTRRRRRRARRWSPTPTRRRRRRCRRSATSSAASTR